MEQFSIQGKGTIDHCTISPVQQPINKTPQGDWTFFFPIVFCIFPFPGSCVCQRVYKNTAFAVPLLSPLLFASQPNLSSNGDLNLDTGLDVDDDLLDDLGGSSQVDEALVDAHLEEIPGLGTLTVGGLAGLLHGSMSVSGNMEKEQKKEEDG